MVYQQIRKSKTVNKLDFESTIIMALLLMILMTGSTLVIYYFITGIKSDSSSVVENNVIIEDEKNISDKSNEKDVEVKKIDFQPIVDEWAASTGGNKSILIYDLDRNEVAGSYNTKENYNTASLYKLFVVYEGYKRLEKGEWKADESAGSTGYNILECLDLSIRESYSPCAEVLWARIGHDELNEIVENNFKIHDSDISHLVSNVSDIAEIMKLFFKHPDIKKEELISKIKDSFLNQPKTEYNWRQGLPSGFSKANIYNKVGWEYNEEEKYWEAYHDAAIVEFPETNRHFVVVVMTNKVPFQKIRDFGTKIEETFYNNQ